MRKYPISLMLLIAIILFILLFSSCSFLPVTNNAKSYALIIGINAYQDANTLSWCVNDANGMEDALINNGWEKDQITKLLDTNATKEHIKTELTDIINKTTSNDYILVFYSGHGTQIPDTNGDETDGYDEAIVPVDFNGDISSLIIDDDLGEIFSHSKTQKGVFIFDSCFSGGFINKSLTNSGLKVRSLTNAKAVGDPTSQDLDIYNIPVLTASSYNEEAYEDSSLEHGVFTYSILKGFENMNADYNNDGYITVREIFKYAETYTRTLTDDDQHPELQAPQFFTDILITH
ncbi:MAG: hypothetical protein DRP84_04885 [Spirochaetes bacterium]|nr:MAG: hypothetical protein DRP84_04885 [Spirochaetota bacterium]